MIHIPVLSWWSVRSVNNYVLVDTGYCLLVLTLIILGVNYTAHDFVWKSWLTQLPYSSSAHLNAEWNMGGWIVWHGLSVIVWFMSVSQTLLHKYYVQRTLSCSGMTSTSTVRLRIQWHVYTFLKSFCYVLNSNMWNWGCAICKIFLTKLVHKYYGSMYREHHDFMIDKFMFPLLNGALQLNN